MVRDNSLRTITTVNLYAWQQQWMDENGLNRSDFVREAVTKEIDRQCGTNVRLTELRKRKAELESELAEVGGEIEKLSEKMVAEEDEREERRIRAIIKRIHLGEGIREPDEIYSHIIEHYPELPEEAVDLLVKEYALES